ncbi:MAG: fibronectin type III domain-containing protein [Saprospirales bacterium]|nr:MAG: fibronectin type III domain-containing protein [Saprospirales bacterium]
MLSGLYDINQGDINIRWAPHDFNCWQMGVEKGYTIYRVTLVENGVELPDSLRTESGVYLAEDIKPVPTEEFEQLPYDTNLVDIAWGALYSDEFDVDFDVGDSSMLHVYEYSIQNENRFNFALMACDQSFDIARASGLGYTDTTAQINSTYLYYVFVPSEDTTQTSLAYTSIEVKYEEINTPLDTVKIDVVIPGDHTVSLGWSAVNYASVYSSYLIERSDDLGQTFHLRVDHPFMFMESEDSDLEEVVFTDSLSENNVPYIYRVRGINFFGREGPNSDTVWVIGKPGPLGVFPVNLSHVELEEDKVLINWEFPDSLESELSGFEILRSPTRRGVYDALNVNLLSPDSRVYVDESASSDGFYQVVGIDNHGHRNPSIPHMVQLTDTIPPDIPTGLSGTIDKNGVVSLEWDANQEEDLYGYRLMRSDHPDGDFMQIASRVIRDTTFYDYINLKDLNRYVYYRILSVDNRQNESDPSDPVKIKKPDIVPPAPPVILQLEPGQGSISVIYNESASLDVAEHRLQRLKVGEYAWISLSDFDQNGGERDSLHSYYTFTDTTTESQVDYRYRMVAVDSSGNESVSSIVTGRAWDDGLRGTITDEYGLVFTVPDYAVLQSQMYHLDKGILLQWNYPITSEVVEFVIYRQRQHEPLRIYKTLLTREGEILNPTQLKDDSFFQSYLDKDYYFFDNQITRSGTYEYRIIARHHDGGFSQMTDVINLNIN